jgi:hypothetical protein
MWYVMEIEDKELERNGVQVELYFPKTSEMIYMPSIAGRKRRNVIGPLHFSLR